MSTPPIFNVLSPTPSLILLLGFSLMVVGLGFFLKRFTQSRPDFFLAGKKLSLAPVAFTFVASWFGAASTLATSQAVALKGLNGLWDMAIPSVITCILIATLMAKRVSKMPGLSMPEAVENYYGPIGRFILACVVVIASTTLMAAQLIAAGQVLETLFNWSFLATVIGFSFVVVAYSMAGGYWAVVITDMLQLALIILGLSIPLWAFGAPSIHFSGEAIPLRLHELIPTANQLGMTLTFVLGWLVAPEMWQRMTSLKNPNSAKPSVLLATLILIGLFCLVTCLGFIGQTLASANPESTLQHQAAWVLIANNINNPVLAALMTLGISCAIASTLDSSLNVASLTVVHDITPKIQHWLGLEKSTNVLPLWPCRLATFLLMVPAVWIAVSFQNIIHVLWLSADVYASAMAIPIIAMVLFPPVEDDIKDKVAFKHAGLYAMTTGGAIVLTGRLIQALPSPLNTLWPQWPWGTLIGIAVSTTVFVTTYALKRR